MPQELTAAALFDDFTTVDPCSLTSPEVFDAFGATEYATPESLEYCAISVDVADGSDVLIVVGAFEELATRPDLPDKRVKDVAGGLWVGQLDDKPSFCWQTLVFPDDVHMQVLGRVLDGGDADTCPMVEAGMDHATRVILDEGVEHRAPERNSLMLVDPCTLASDSAIGAIAGLAGARQPYGYPAKHNCFWEAGGEVSARVQFGAGPEPVATEAGGNEEPVAGRPTVTNPYPELRAGSYCVVATAHIPFTEVEEINGVFELASVAVVMPKGQVDTACAAARAVAALVWPKLPAV